MTNPKQPKWEREFEKEFAFGDEYLCLYSPRTKSYTSVGESIKFFIARTRKQAQREMIEEIRLEFKVLPKDFFKGVSATQAQLYLSTRKEIIEEAVNNLQAFLTTLKQKYGL